MLVVIHPHDKQKLGIRANQLLPIKRKLAAINRHTQAPTPPINLQTAGISLGAADFYGTGGFFGAGGFLGAAALLEAGGFAGARFLGAACFASAATAALYDVHIGFPALGSHGPHVYCKGCPHSHDF